MNRRNFIGEAVGIIGLLGSNPLYSIPLTERKKLMVYCQQFTLLTFFEREDKKWDKEMTHLSDLNISGYELILEVQKSSARRVKQLVDRKTLAPSVYMDPFLHMDDTVDSEVKKVIQLAQNLRQYGVKIIVLNPATKSEEITDQKDDKELKVQVLALDRIGAELRRMGIRLLFHNHLTEMQDDGREFNHCLHGVQPENMGLCLDADWVRRGLGSTDALYDITKTYINRIDELHLRQTQENVWTEYFGVGDIDYRVIAELLNRHGKKPLLMLEQAVSDESPKTMTAFEAIAKSLDNVEDVFKSFSTN